MDPAKTDLQKKLTERFATLPPVVQNAVTSADVEKHLRELANTHKLHIDQWDALENEVMLTLLGFQRTEDLPGNIAKEIGMKGEAAAALAGEISRIVFEPIREELERELEHPEAQGPKTNTVDDVRVHMLSKVAGEEVPKKVPVVPATPPPAAPLDKVERAPASTSYANSASHERKAVEGDPYREQVA
jgi:hypothetical protein